MSRLAAAAAAGTALTVADSPLTLAWFGSSSSGAMELRYFDGKGAVESSRLLLAMSGTAYTDTRWKMDMSKPYGQRCQGFMAAKKTGELEANLDRAPILLVDGVAIGQSKSIERYIARRVGLYGANEIEAAQCDAFCEHLRDLKEMHGKAADAKAFNAETLPAFFEKLEKVAGDKSCIVGKSLSIADVAFYELVHEYFPARDAYLAGKEPNAKKFNDQSAQGAAMAKLESCPKLASSIAAVRKHPGVAEHIAGRQYTAPW